MLSVINDTTLLGAGIPLALISRRYLWSRLAQRQTGGLLAYILLGTLVLKRAKNPACAHSHRSPSRWAVPLHRRRCPDPHPALDQSKLLNLIIIH